MRHFLSVILILFALSAALFAIAGLRGRISSKPPIEIFSDMNRQPKLRPQEPDSFFTSGVSSQLPPPGTIARRQPIQTVSGEVYTFEDSPVNTGYTPGGNDYVDVNPLPVTMQLLQHGQERFDIFCAPCHGRLGDGNGITKAMGDMPSVGARSLANWPDEPSVTALQPDAR